VLQDVARINHGGEPSSILSHYPPRLPGSTAQKVGKRGVDGCIMSHKPNTGLRMTHLHLAGLGAWPVTHESMDLYILYCSAASSEIVQDAVFCPHSDGDLGIPPRGRPNRETVH